MPLRVIQLGVAGPGRNWWEAFDATAGIELAALVEPDPEARRLAAERYGVPAEACFDDPGAPWDRVPAQLVVDSTPPAQHFDNASRALAAGKNLMTVAPLASSVDQAVRLVNTAEAAKLKLVVAQPLRFHPLALKLYDVVSEHKLGPVRELELECRVQRPPGAEPKPNAPDPLVVDLACHHLDLVRWCLMQDAVKAEAVGPNVFAFDMHEGARVTYRVVIDGDQAPTGWFGRWRVAGRDAAMTLEDHTIHVGDEDITPEWDDRRPITDLCLGRLHLITLNHMLVYLQDLAEPGVSGANNLNSLAMVAAALQSQFEGRPVDVTV